MFLKHSVWEENSRALESRSNPDHELDTNTTADSPRWKRRFCGRSRTSSGIRRRQTWVTLVWGTSRTTQTYMSSSHQHCDHIYCLLTLITKACCGSRVWAIRQSGWAENDEKSSMFLGHSVQQIWPKASGVCKHSRRWRWADRRTPCECEESSEPPDPCS